MTFVIKAACDGPSPKSQCARDYVAVGSMDALYDQPLTQRKLRAIEPRCKWVQFNEEKVGNVPICLG
jgi:hypothetical protein